MITEQDIKQLEIEVSEKKKLLQAMKEECITIKQTELEKKYLGKYFTYYGTEVYHTRKVTYDGLLECMLVDMSDGDLLVDTYTLNPDYVTHPPTFINKDKVNSLIREYTEALLKKLYK